MIDVMRTVGSVRLRFTWDGGLYAHAHMVGRTAAEVINMSDVPVTQEAFIAEVNAWIDNYGGTGATPLQSRALLEHDVRENWPDITQPSRRGPRPRGRR